MEFMSNSKVSEFPAKGFEFMSNSKVSEFPAKGFESVLKEIFS
jgi:hypothetical protein